MSEPQVEIERTDAKPRDYPRFFNCPECGRFAKITHAASWYDLDGLRWTIEGICQKCGFVSEWA